MTIYAFDEFELDTALYELRRRGARVAMEPQVFTVLAYLIENRDRVVTKSQLIDHVWPERFISEAALTSRLMAARKAVGDSGQAQRYIRTVHGRGYQFVAAVRESGEPAPNAATEAVSAGEAAGAAGFADTQDIRFCKTPDGVRVAYATSGTGSPLVKVANWLSHLEFDWRSPVWRHWISEFSRHHTLVRYDERGCGLSDRDVEDYSVEAWTRDLESVVDALGLERFPLMGISQGGPVAITYAVRHPERVSQLILYGTYVQGRKLRGKTREQIEEQEALATLMRIRWGLDDPSFRAMFAAEFIPGASEEEKRWFNDLCRVSTSPEGAERFYRAFGMIDVSNLLSRVSTPTLVVHATEDKRIPIEQAQKLAAEIPGARFVALEGQNHILLESEPAWPRFVAEIRRFLGVRREAERETATVHTILFTDLEDSTGLTRRLGDRASRELFRQLEVEIRGLVSMHGGGDVKGLGDGIMASFKVPTRALECAVAIQRAAERLAELRGTQLRVRVGLHVGEAIAEAGDLHGIAVITASRIVDAARGGEILVSDAVRQLAASRGFAFSATREFVPKGFDEPVRVHQVEWAA